MKKLYTTLMMAMMGLMTLSFTSCETDEQIANTLEGTWRGDMTIEDYNGVSYVESEITFLKDPYTYSEGTGLWVDYYADGYVAKIGILHYPYKGNSIIGNGEIPKVERKVGRSPYRDSLKSVYQTKD